MVTPNFYRKSKKLLLLLVICLATSLLLFSHRTTFTNNQVGDILPLIGVTYPDLDLVGYLPGSASPCTFPTPALVAFVHSSPSHVPHRDAIRRTWGSPGARVKTVFVVGRTQNEKVWQRVQQEAQNHRDLVLLDITDSYRNLTLKHLLGLKWVLANCPYVPYVLKSDDDVFVDTIRLRSLLDTLLGRKDVLVCHVIPKGSSPRRNGKWKVDREEYPFDEYPEYCSGQAYFTRMATLGSLSEVARSGSIPYLPIDDVFVTGLSAALAGVERQDLGVRFANNEQPVVEWVQGGSLRLCPWMVAEMSPYYWPKEAARLWNKTVASWKTFRRSTQRKEENG